MPEKNKKNGRKSSGRKHGGKDLKKTGKRRMAPKKVSRPPIAPAPKSFANRVEPPSIPDPPVEAPRLGASPIAATASPLEGPVEPEAFDPAVGVGPTMSRGKLAVIAVVVAAACGIALLRACEPKATPIEDDAVETGPCSDDASLCVAWA